MKAKIIIPIGILFLLGLSFWISEHVDCDGDNLYTLNPDSLLNEGDKHSYSNYYNLASEHVSLDLNFDFDNKIVSGKVTHRLRKNDSSKLFVLDINGLNINHVYADGKPVPYEIQRHSDSAMADIHGQALMINVPVGANQVSVVYETTPDCKALQWLNPEQTFDKKHPYLLSQGQAILNRSWIPLQDSPENKISYDAKITVPKDLMAVMSAANPQEKNEEGIYYFEMSRNIPSYLIAIAIGDIKFQPLGDRTGVYAEPGMLEKSAKEFEDVEAMLAASETLFGPYVWGRYDVIVLPPSFPFGGMENPKLTFATPTIITGDKSLVGLIAHEMAHSWSGNLVTNATWDDFWLNEGFTDYCTSRIMEEIYGVDIANMMDIISHQELMHTIEGYYAANMHDDTKLKLNLQGRDPDDGMSDIAYVKGKYLLKSIENEVGREAFDAFLKTYFTQFSYKSLNTEEFLAFIDEKLLKAQGVDFDMDKWVYAKGLPEDSYQSKSKNFAKMDRYIKAFDQGGDPAGFKLELSDLDTHEWMYFIRRISDSTAVERLVQLDHQFGFKDCGNSEIMAEWYVKCIEAGNTEVYPQVEEFLTSVGRRKFLTPIYSALVQTKEGKKVAHDIYEKARNSYHSISYNTIDEILDV